MRAPARHVAALLLGACACSNPGAPPPAARGGLTTESDSRSQPDRAQRLALLARYLTTKSPIADAEYVIHYRDNSAGAVPGPSDWDIRAALQLSGDTAPWHAGWEPCPAAPTDVPAWGRELLARRPEWQHLAAPRCFRDPRHHATYAFVYDADHLVVYRNASEPGADDPS